MIFHILRIQLEHIELLHEADHLRAAEVAERVTGQAQTNRRCFDGCRTFLSQCEGVARGGEPRRSKSSRTNEIATRETIFHRLLITRSLPRMLSSGIRLDATSARYIRGAQPFSYSRPHIFIASGSPWIWPSFVSRCISRFTSHAMLEICSIVTEILPTEKGGLSFPPLRFP